MSKSQQETFQNNNTSIVDENSRLIDSSISDENVIPSLNVGGNEAKYKSSDDISKVMEEITPHIDWIFLKCHNKLFVSNLNLINDETVIEIAEEELRDIKDLYEGLKLIENVFGNINTNIIRLINGKNNSEKEIETLKNLQQIIKENNIECNAFKIAILRLSTLQYNNLFLLEAIGENALFQSLRNNLVSLKQSFNNYCNLVDKNSLTMLTRIIRLLDVYSDAVFVANDINASLSDFNQIENFGDEEFILKNTRCFEQDLNNIKTIMDNLKKVVAKKIKTCSDEDDIDSLNQNNKHLDQLISNCEMYKVDLNIILSHYYHFKLYQHTNKHEEFFLWL